jgi:hypothetical protein
MYRNQLSVSTDLRFAPLEAPLISCNHFGTTPTGRWAVAWPQAIITPAGLRYRHMALAR